MKIVLTQKEFETMASAWVFENLVEKNMASARIVGDQVELEVFGSNDAPEDIEHVEVVDDDDDDDDYNLVQVGQA
jgi:hypothetical protein